MKTVNEIRETIEETKYRLREKNPFVCTDRQMGEIEGWINALEWVLEEEPVTDWEVDENRFWNRIVEMAGEAEPASREEILNDLERSLRSPFPFFTHLKEKEDAAEEKRETREVEDKQFGFTVSFEPE